MAEGGPALLFDLDGVLVDSRRPIAGSINAALRAHRLEPFPEPQLHGFIGAPLRAVFASLLATRGADAALVEPCLASYRAYYARVSLTDTTLVVGIPDALEQLRSVGRLAVATSKPVEFAAPILEQLGIRRCFEAVFGPPLDRSEPKSAVVGRALGGVRRRPAQGALLVGDTRFDVEAGRAHGIPVLGATWGIGSAGELRIAGADRLVERPEELCAAVVELVALRDGEAASGCRR